MSCVDVRLAQVPISRTRDELFIGKCAPEKKRKTGGEFIRGKGLLRRGLPFAFGEIKEPGGGENRRGHALHGQTVVAVSGNLPHYKTDVTIQGGLVYRGAESPLEKGLQALLGNKGPQRMVLFIGGPEEGIRQGGIAVKFAGIDDGTSKFEKAFQ